jgi:hypothetical protein
MTRISWCFLGFLLFMLSAALLSSSCSQGQARDTALSTIDQSVEQQFSLVRELVIVLEDALEVRTSAGGFGSSGGRLFLSYYLSSVPPRASEAATRLKQKLESLDAIGVEAGVVGSVIIVDFEQLSFKGNNWQGFIQVYGQRLSGYLNPISSGS